MKKIARRGLGALLLAAILLAGTVFFAMEYAVSADRWVTHPGSPHVYENGVLRSGTVTSADGQLLLQLEGQRIYHENPAVRTAFLHLLGDSSGNISSGLLSRYSRQLVGYSPVNGVFGAEKADKNMELSVFASVQTAAYAALNGRKGTVAVYDYVNGKILCAVSSNAYDPLREPDVASDTTGKYDGIYVNRFTGSVYVPGSIFKLVTAACALDTYGEAILQKEFTCAGTLTVGEDVVTCGGNHGTLMLKEALAKSCNCTFGQLAMDLGAEKLQSYVNQMGLTESHAVDGIQTAAGRFDLTEVTDVDLAWSGIGQHTVMVNPYSFLRFVGAIAGSGTAAEPYFVSKVGAYRAKTRQFNLPFAEGTAEILQELMANNVQTVYGPANFPDVTVCAKSGTAEVGEGQTPHATFAGFVSDARYPLAFVVVVENGGSGSGVCAPIAGKVLSACISAMENVR